MIGIASVIRKSFLIVRSKGNIYFNFLNNITQIKQIVKRKLMILIIIIKYGKQRTDKKKG